MTADGVIVSMDSDSSDKLKQPADSKWDRRLLVRLLRKLKDGGSRAHP